LSVVCGIKRKKYDSRGLLITRKKPTTPEYLTGFTGSAGFSISQFPEETEKDAPVK